MTLSSGGGVGREALRRPRPLSSRRLLPPRYLHSLPAVPALAPVSPGANLGPVLPLTPVAGPVISPPRPCHCCSELSLMLWCQGEGPVPFSSLVTPSHLILPITASVLSTYPVSPVSPVPIYSIYFAPGFSSWRQKLSGCWYQRILHIYCARLTSP